MLNNVKVAAFKMKRKKIICSHYKTSEKKCDCKCDIKIWNLFFSPNLNDIHAIFFKNFKLYFKHVCMGIIILEICSRSAGSLDWPSRGARPLAYVLAAVLGPAARALGIIFINSFELFNLNYFYVRFILFHTWTICMFIWKILLFIQTIFMLVWYHGRNGDLAWWGCASSSGA